MDTFSALLAICAENSPVPGEFPAQRPVTRSFDVFFDPRLNKLVRLVIWETIVPLWRHRNGIFKTLPHTWYNYTFIEPSDYTQIFNTFAQIR